MKDNGKEPVLKKRTGSEDDDEPDTNPLNLSIDSIGSKRGRPLI